MTRRTEESSHSYSCHFALNPDWPRFLSRAEDIWKYLDRVCKVFNLRKYMRFNVEVIGAYWQEEQGKWLVKLRQSFPDDGGYTEFEDHCHLLLYATGTLSTWKRPDVNGLDSFQGRLIHTARWPEDYWEEQWSNQRVAVIGSGASSIQIVPSMQPYVKHMDVFVRTGVWFAPVIEGLSQDYVYTEEEKRMFREDPAKLVEHAKSLESQLNTAWDLFLYGSKAQKMAEERPKERMAKFIKDERLLKGFTPNRTFGCRRITPGDPYMKAPRFPIIGRNGVSLAEKWHTEPVAYFGLTVPDMPNFVAFTGPPSPVQNGAPFGVFDANSKHCQDVLRGTSFSDDCRSWYKNNETGKMYAVYPGSSLHYMEMLSNPRWEDYNIEYGNKNNMWGFMGPGHVRQEKTPGADLCPYLSVENLDPKWLEEIQS
ncbi:hypothetical protein VTN77DRAFT_7226 [Rasamsonia byssochlamydoides]|uniref:uncharacterized protein n=1 Tax=Rasamsonia byssochlamydoides TaxID=89139 RepID=UPI0037435E73